ncbi:hypothetical protein ACEWY4_017065 [Coilia grayii]|uniref:Nuclear protein MDM1 n=1 Tax=Coilia grayii TaxID=363190 RepID=A0ABD1JM96_9TELE
MLLAGVRSDHLGISREPQFLSRRKIPTHPPQVSRSLQWDLLSERSSTEPAPAPTPASAAREAVGPEAVVEAGAEVPLPETPVAPRGPRHPEAPDPEEQSHPQPEPHMPSPSPTDWRAEPPVNGVHRVLMRRAGLRPGRPGRGRHHSSEYQRQFEWKDRVANSPLLAAEQALHSSVVLPMHGSNPVPLESEYSRNYKGSPPPRPPRLRSDVERNEIPLFHRENVPPEKGSKAKRKKRKEQHLDRKRSNSKEEVTQCQPITSTKQEASHPKPQPTVAPCHGYRKFKTEYDASFRSPLQYQYRDGAWVKVANIKDEGLASAHSVAWYHEVRELREKAEMYRRRAWGTHFSRNHLNQILSEQNHLWEASATSGSSPVTPGSSHATAGSSPAHSSRATNSPIIEALDLARVGSGAGSASSGPSAGHASTRGRPDAPAAPVPPKQAWADPEGPERKSKGAEPPAERAVERTADEEQGDDGVEVEEGEREDGEKEGDGDGGGGGGYGEPESELPGCCREGGRLATPRMKALALAQRTHHDRTTPATGALLVSPPRVKAPVRERASPSPLGKPRSPQRATAHTPLAPTPSKVEDARLVRSPPTAGLTTVDPIPLREDVWCGTSVAEEPRKRSPAPRSKTSRRRTPNTQVWASPSATLPVNRIQGALRNPEFQHNEERLSQISARSAASCSMAAHVLGRAQKRKEDFWGKS